MGRRNDNGGAERPVSSLLAAAAARGDLRLAAATCAVAADALAFAEINREAYVMYVRVTQRAAYKSHSDDKIIELVRGARDVMAGAVVNVRDHLRNGG
jgi:hypothetical protein